MEFNKVSKYQAGGYLTYQPLPVVPQEQPQVASAPDTSTSKKDKEVDGLDDDILKKMIGEGITTDVMAYSDQVKAAYQRYAMMDDNMRNSYMGKQLRQMMKGDLGQLNMLARSKKYLDNNIEKAKAQNGLDEGAISSNGQVFVKDANGKVATLSLSEFNADHNSKESKYQLLTNAQLAEEREFNPQLLGNNNITNVISFAVGMDKVKEEVYKAASDLGNTTTNSISGAYGDGENSDMDALKSAVASGAFKIKDGTVDSTNRPQIEKAQAQLWAGLSAGAKATLRLRAATMVDKPNDIEQKAKDLAAEMLDPRSTVMHKEIHDETFKKLTGGKGSTAGDKPTDFGQFEMAFNLRSNVTPLRIDLPKGATVETTAAMVPALANQGKDGVAVSLQDNTNMRRIANVNSAFTVNGDKVNPRDTAIIGNSYIQWLPVIKGADGTMQIDQEGAKKWAAIQKANPNTPQSELAIKYGLSLNLHKLVASEAASFGDSTIGWFDPRRDSDYYTPLDDATSKYVQDIVDPKHQRVHNTFNHASKHWIFMESLDQASWREADNNHATLPAHVFSANPYNDDGTINPNAYNTGRNGANIAQGIQYQQQQQIPTNLTSGFFQK